METIGRYRLERRLGSGAFATVWLAQDPDLAVPVAVKVLADNWSHDLDIRERFVAEARLLRRIGHDRVVRVYDIGELPDGRPYFVMDYADSGTVDDVLAAKPDLVTALTIGAETALGLQVLHDKGVVHRDVKPGNLLVTTGSDGGPHVVIADLGMAKALAEASGLTVTAGTPAYMAPEQAQGAGGFDHRADVYGAAAVTYALLAGRPPYPVDGTMVNIAKRSPKLVPEPIAHTVGAPPELDDLLESALAHDPAKRPQTAADLASRLSGIRERVEGGAAPARGPGWSAKGLVALGLATFVVFAAATWLTLRLLG